MTPIPSGDFPSVLKLNILDNLAIAISNMILSAPGMVQGSGVNTKLKAGNTTTYLSAGVLATKTTFEIPFTTSGNGSFTGAYDVTPNAGSVQERVYVVYLNAAGTATMIVGAQATGSGNGLYPDMPGAGGTGLRTPGLTPIGGVRIAVAAGASGFQANTTQPATSGAVTATYFDGYPVQQLQATQ